MFAYAWPIGLIVLSNIIYHICAKSMPEVNSFAALMVTYLVGAACALALFLAGDHGSVGRELSKMNWAPYALGVAIVGLELGNIYAYKAGWPISTAAIVQSCFLAAALVIVGLLLYQEPVTWNKAVGVLICLVGLFFINMK